jgi:hypothetical protein
MRAAAGRKAAAREHTVVLLDHARGAKIIGIAGEKHLSKTQRTRLLHGQGQDARPIALARSDGRML